VTDGARGVWFTQGDGLSHLPAFPVRPVDTLGAGDAFSAGLAAALVEGRPFEECLRRAAACGALATRRIGVLAALPTRAELERFLAT
jgi:ribokinase